jgi:hypothetical protein
MPDRLADVYNVKDYGAVGNGAFDNTTVLNALLAATSGGGTIYFPPGIYAIGSSLVLPNDQAGRRLIGAGSDKTKISGNFDQYILYNAQVAAGNKPVSHIEGITFKNDYALAKASFTTPDPITKPGGTATGACGGIYLPNSSWVAIRRCDFEITSGVAVYTPGIANSISTLNITMGFNGVFDLPISIGIWGCAHIDTGKIMGCRYGIVNIQNPGYINNLDIERCQNGIYFGNPYPFWDRNSGLDPDPIKPANTIGALHQRVNGIQFESCGSASEGGSFVDLAGCTSSILTNIKCSSFAQIGTPQYGFKLAGTSHCRFEDCEATGDFSVAAFGYTGNTATSNIFKSCTGAVASGGGVPWLLQSSTQPQGYTPDIFLNCYPADGGMTLANLPPAPAGFGCTAICTDSTLPAWNGTVSNVGKPIVPGGTYRVTARCGTVAPTIAAAASWTTASTTITMALSNPGSVVTAGMGVVNATTGEVVGKVSSYTGTTLTLTSTALSASRGSTDNLVFTTWCIAG